MNLSNLHPAEDLSIVIVSEEAVATLLEMVRQLVRDIRARRHVPAHRDLVSRAARCRYTDVFRREDLQTSTPRRSLELM